MRIVILTSTAHGPASRVLPVLCKNDNIDVVKVILVRGGPPNRKRNLKRKLLKVLKIGVLGALNGITIRKWYADNDAEDIHAVCESLGVDLAETPFMASDRTRQLFREAYADLGLSLGNGYIPKSVYCIPQFGMVNLHMEILPQYQGGQSIIWPIHEGKTETGFTIHQIDSRIDTGDILYQEKYSIQFFPTLRETVEKNLAIARSKIPAAFNRVCEEYLSLRARATPQLHGRSYTTPSLFQFMRMKRNHRIMYNASRTQKMADVKTPKSNGQLA